MRIIFSRTVEMEMTRVEPIPGLNVHDLTDMLANGTAILKYDDHEGVHVITCDSRGRVLGSVGGIQPTAASAEDRNFSAME